MVNLITGRQGSGKSRLIYENIVRDMKENKDTYLIVPEQYSFEAEKEIIDISGLPGIIGIHVLSFSRLAYQLLNKAGQLQKQPLSKKASLIILKKILLDLSDDLIIYSKSATQDGFCNIMLDCIFEFKKNRVKYDELYKLSQSQLLRIKMDEIKKIYESYETYINNDYYDAEDLIEQASKEILYSNVFENANVYIDGFYTLDKQRLHLIDCIMQQADNVSFCLTYDIDYDRDVFSISEKLKTDLISLAKENKLKISEIKLNKKIFCSNSIKHIEENIFKYNFKKYIASECEALPEVHILNNANKEAEYAANTIIKLVQSKNLRYKDIAVFSNNLDEYSQLIQRVFDQYQIPYFIDERYDIFHNSLVRMLLSLLRMLDKDNFYYKDVFEFLKTGYSNLDNEEINKLENYVLKYGIKRKDYFYEFKKAVKKDENLLDEINDVRKKFEEQIKPWQEKAKPLKTYDQIAAFIEEVIENETVKEKIVSSIKFCEENVLNIQKSIEEQITDIIKENLEFIKYFLKDKTATMEDFYDVLRQTLNSDNAGLLPVLSDCVIVGDFARSRISTINTAIIVGAVDGAMPKKLSSDGIFTQKEKQELTKKGLNITGEERTHSFKENFYIYNVLSRPKERLIITAPLLNENNDENHLCPSAEQICKMFELNNLYTDEKSTLVSNEKGTYQSLINQISKYVQNNAVPDKDAIELFNWYEKNVEYANKISMLKKALTYDNAEENLSKQDIRAIKTNPFNLSASNIKAYAECPFKYFVQYTLRPQKREIWEINSLDIGNLMHSTGEKFTRHVLENSIDLKKITSSEIERIVDSIIIQSEQEFKSGFFGEDNLNKAILNKASHVAKKTIGKIVEHINSGEFKISGSEIEFGNNKKLPAINLGNIDGIDINIEGKIDRIDTYEHKGKTYYKVFDYKTGNVVLDYKKIFHGIDLQLILYMKACIADNVDKMPAGMFYYKFDSPIVKYENNVDIDQLNDLISKNMRFYGISTNDEDIILAIDHNAKDNEKRSCNSIKFNNDNSIAKSSHVFTNDEVNIILKHSMQLVEKFSKEILSGVIEASPYKSSCAYCEYKNICNFDTCFENNKYKKIEKVNKNTIIDKIKGQSNE